MFRRCLFAAMLLAVPLVALAAGEESDWIRRQVPGAAPSPPFQPEFQFSFGFPARWPGKTMRWRYNPSGAPTFFGDKVFAAHAISAAAARWSAVCGIQFVYEGETAAPPYNGSDPVPDYLNVVGWRELAPATIGLTYTWNAAPPSASVLVDADILLSPSRVFSAEQMARTAAHEWGHAIGIGHSNLSGALMSGLPDSPYSGYADTQPDDVRACRCLYGAAAGQPAAYACSLPTVVDFGVQTVGIGSAPKRVTFTNDATATLPLTVNGTSIASGEFFVTATTCTPVSPLSPGAGCTIDIAARPALAGTRNAEAVVTTSDGAYRLPLVADGDAPPVTQSFQGIWWNAPAGSESGWGLNVAHQGDTIFASWFTYDTTGRGAWYVMTAPKTTADTFAGTLYRTTGPPFGAVPWSPAAVTKTIVGNGVLHFNDANNGGFAYTVDGISQAKSITRQVFGPLPVCTFGGQPNLALATNYQDLWWASPAGSESGWGINLNHQGDTIFATWFTYDLDGTPLWLVVTAPKIGPGTYSGDLYRTAGARFDAFDPAAVVRTKVGTATFTFADGNRATFAYAVQLAGMAAPLAQSKTITREVFTAPGTACN